MRPAPLRPRTPASAIAVAAAILFCVSAAPSELSAQPRVTGASPASLTLEAGGEARSVLLTVEGLTEVQAVRILQGRRAVSGFQTAVRRTTVAPGRGGTASTFQIEISAGPSVSPRSYGVELRTRRTALRVPLELRVVAAGGGLEPSPADQAAVRGGLGREARPPAFPDGPTPPAVETVRVTSFRIDGGASRTRDRNVTLEISAERDPTHYRASESPNLAAVPWKAFEPRPSFTLSDGEGVKTVHLQLRGDPIPSPTIRGVNLSNESPPVSASIRYTVPKAYFRGNSLYYYPPGSQQSVGSTGYVELELHNFDTRQSGVGRYSENVALHRPRWEERPCKGLLGDGKQTYVVYENRVYRVNARDITWRKLGAGRVEIQSVNPFSESDVVTMVVGVTDGGLTASREHYLGLWALSSAEYKRGSCSADIDFSCGPGAEVDSGGLLPTCKARPVEALPYTRIEWVLDRRPDLE